MAPKKQATAPVKPLESKKRKDPPQSSSNDQKRTNRGPNAKRVKTHDARSILTQTSDAALKNGELDVQSFLKAREFEIKALQDGMRRSKSRLTTRAFQQVPRDMRRRTASHNVKRVPKRLQKRASREMKDDNTPTVIPNKRKPGNSRGRIRAETAKRLGILAAKKLAPETETGGSGGIKTREARPKIRKDRLNDPPKPKSKFRKRQIDKTWLPTHLWHAKRAKMTEPFSPLWRFAIPITSTEKSYRPTHRAGGARGAVAWDMSYMSTIGLEGFEPSLEKILKALGVGESGLWEEKGMKWRCGKRAWSGWLTKRVNEKPITISPATVFWNPIDGAAPTNKPATQRVLIRVHPSAFLEVWTELLLLSKPHRPAVHIRDLRFEIGSIDITGPASTEALLGILHPYPYSEGGIEEHAKMFKSLAGVTNPASLPPNAILSFSIMDPRLQYPPRTVKPPKLDDEETTFSFLERLATWSVDEAKGSSALFDREARFKATRLPSQKSLNRRKSQEPPGSYPSILQSDPAIPIMLLTSRIPSSGGAQGIWTLLAPWKCILPIWYGLMHYPLFSGGNPRFGGLQELRQVYFEHGAPWFPVDFPGTSAGLNWETNERNRRKEEWDKRPKGKRIEWSSLDLGAGRKGEIGRGWACDFEFLIGSTSMPATDDLEHAAQDSPEISKSKESNVELPIEHLPAKEFTRLMSSSFATSLSASAIAAVRLTLVSRGVATPCARIYRLPGTKSPSNSSDTSIQSLTTREQWLALVPSSTSKPVPNPKKVAQNTSRIPLNTALPQRVRLLAQSLLQNPPLPYPASQDPRDDYPLVPDEEDLIGFVTTGEFNLAEGKGIAVGSVVVSKVIETLKGGKKGAREGRLCIVRNVGEKTGRLAKWEPV